jgi:hypothetical protein
MLRGQSSRDTALVLEGQLVPPIITATMRGTTLRGTYRRID